MKLKSFTQLALALSLFSTATAFAHVCDYAASVYNSSRGYSCEYSSIYTDFWGNPVGTRGVYECRGGGHKWRLYEGYEGCAARPVKYEEMILPEPRYPGTVKPISRYAQPFKLKEESQKFVLPPLPYGIEEGLID